MSSIRTGKGALVSTAGADHPLRVRSSGAAGARQAIAGAKSSPPDMELVGVYAHGAGTVNIAPIVGWPEPSGVRATPTTSTRCSRLHQTCCYNPL